MKLASVNCGLPREVVWHGRIVTTSIYKEPVQGRIALRTLNPDGDRQSDLTVHGGKDKAVYCYPLEHYEYWKVELPGHALPMGAFGENFTTEGLTEDFVHIGDQLSVGSAEVVVSQPRLPCYKLGIRFKSDDMVKRFLASQRTGFYLAVTREGEVGAETRSLCLTMIRTRFPSPSSIVYTSRRNTTKNIFVWCERLSVWKHCPRVGRSTCRKRQQGRAQDPELRYEERFSAVQINWIAFLQNANSRS
jgi:MOSC domain-containing protein YiiM